MNLKSLFFLSAMLCIVGLNAKITMPSFFADNMVLQRESEVSLFGKANPKSKVTVITSWDKNNYSTVSSEDGSWKIIIRTPEAGGPYDISVSDGKKLTLKNILIGEVWFCSGQSNMEMPLEGWGKIMNYKDEISSANYPSIRLLQVKHTYSLYPQDDVEIDFGWCECSPETVSNFSSTAYFFARKLWNELKIPIGLIHSSWGGTPAEAWTSKEGLYKVPSYIRYAAQLDSIQKCNKYENLLYDEQCAWLKKTYASDNGFDGVRPLWTGEDYDDSEWSDMPVPSNWESHGYDSFNGIAWYRKSVSLPSTFAGKDLSVSLGTVDDDDVLYFNGVEIGCTFGYGKARKYIVPGKLVKSGRNVVTVRVIDTGGEGGIIGTQDNCFIGTVKSRKTISLCGMWKFRTGLDFDYNRQLLYDRPVEFRYRPVYLYNAMVNPFVNYKIRGFIWYQGEANETRGFEYRDLFQGMINDWRSRWGDNTLPFYYVQLAPFRAPKLFDDKSKWAIVRESQSEDLHLGNTGMAVITDIGDAKDIHPKNKQEVGRRLALLALENTYKYSDVMSSAPIYSNYRIEGDKVYLSFSNLGNGFLKGGVLNGFFISGTDRIFHKAEATIVNNEIVVSCSEVKYPAAVRYGWADNPVCNLYGSNWLPVSPFRTDNW